MTSTLEVSGYDLSDEGPGRTVNEDATLVRADLGLFALADGAGGRGKGNVASTLALRTLENYVGATVKRTHARADFDIIGNPEQAKRLSTAVHQAHQNVLEVVHGAPDRKGMATTIVATLFSERTELLHIAHVGDSRCYRMRHGRLELLTEDHSVATDILERRPEVDEEVLANLPRNSVVRALGMDADFRVTLRTVSVIDGDRFLLCSDGLSSVVSYQQLEAVMASPESSSVQASELLSHALAAHSQDNISVLVIDAKEIVLDEEVPTRRYNENPVGPPSTPHVEMSDAPNSAEFFGPEIVDESVVDRIEEWSIPPEAAEFSATRVGDVSEGFSAEFISSPGASPISATDLAPSTQTSAELSEHPPEAESAPSSPHPSAASALNQHPNAPPAGDVFNVSEIDLEFEPSEDMAGFLEQQEEVSEVVLDPDAPPEPAESGREHSPEKDGS